jgi:hypothetical protein
MKLTSFFRRILIRNKDTVIFIALGLSSTGNRTPQRFGDGICWASSTRGFLIKMISLLCSQQRSLSHLAKMNSSLITKIAIC